MNIRSIFIMLFLCISCSSSTIQESCDIDDDQKKDSAKLFESISVGYEELLNSKFLVSTNENNFWNKKFIGIISTQDSFRIQLQRNRMMKFKVISKNYKLFVVENEYIKINLSGADSLFYADKNLVTCMGEMIVKDKTTKDIYSLNIIFGKIKK